MSPVFQCPHCGTAIARGAPEGLCMVCLLASGAEEPDEFGDLPRRFGNYELQRILGRGGAGLVFAARQDGLDRTVAVKVLAAGMFADRAGRGRFRAEAQAVAGMDHPGIVPVIEAGEHEGQAFFSMPLLPCGSLAEALRGGLTFRGGAAAAFTAGLARAVHYAHQRGVLHRDIKPGNILLTEGGEPRLTDFGLARLIEQESTLTHTNALLGTPAYMAPEQAQGGFVTTAADIYGLGAVLYELLTGQPPFAGGTSVETVRLLLDTEPRRPSSLRSPVDRDLENICLKCLEKDPSRRYGSAEALAEDLERFMRCEPVQARPAGKIVRLWKWTRRNPGVAALSALLLTGGISAVIAGAAVSVRIADAGRRARENAEQSQRLLTQLYVSNAVREMNEGRTFEALRWSVEALRVGDDVPERSLINRRRIGALLQSAPRLVRLWQREDAQSADEPVAFAGRSHHLLMAGANRQSVMLFDPLSENGAPLWKLDGPWKHIALNPDGNRFLLCRGSSAVCYSSVTGQLCAGPFVHDESLKLGAAGPDGRRMLTAGRTVKIWTLSGGPPVGLAPDAPVAAAVFSPDGEMVLTVSDTGAVQLWNSGDGAPVGVAVRHSGAAAAAFSSDGKHALTQSGQSVRVWDVPDSFNPGRTDIKEIAHGGLWVYGASFDPAGGRIISSARDATARVWQAGKETRPLFALRHGNGVRSASFSADGLAILTGSDDRAAYFWSAEDGAPLETPLPHSRSITRAVLSADGTMAAVSGDGITRLWDLAGSSLAGPPLHVPGGRSVAFSADGNTIVVRDARSDLRQWNWRDGIEMFTPPDLEPERVIMDDLPPLRSPDGSRILTVNGATAGVHDAGGTLSAGPMLHREYISCAVWSADGKLVLTGSGDRTARVWDAASGEPVTPPWIHGSTVLHAAFSPDGRYAATVSYDGFARVWQIPHEGRDAESLSSLLDFLTCRRVTEQGSLAVFDDPPEQSQQWSAWLRQWPEAFAPAPVSRTRRVAENLARQNAAVTAAVLDVKFGPDAHRAKAEVCVASKDYALAVAEFDRALLTDAPDAGLLAGRAGCHERLKCYDRAAADYLAALEIQPSQPRWLLSLAGCLLQQNLPEPALKAAQDAAGLLPHSAAAHDTAAAALLKLRRWDEAAAAAARSRRIALPSVPLPPRSIDDRKTLDLSGWYNASCDGVWLLPRSAGVRLAGMPRDLKSPDGTPFDIRGIVQLSGGNSMRRGAPWPDSLRGLRLGGKAAVIHLLHGCAGRVPDGTAVATLTIHYADGTQWSAPVISGSHLRPLDSPAAPLADPGASAVWSGGGVTPVTIYRATFTTPHPEKDAAILELVSAGTDAAPFVISIVLTSTPQGPG